MASAQFDNWDGNAPVVQTAATGGFDSYEPGGAVVLEVEGMLVRSEVLPVEWFTHVKHDAILPVAWSGNLRENFRLPVEWEAGRLYFSPFLPVEFDGSKPRTLDVLLPVEWSGSVETSLGAALPVEWGGSTLLTLDQLLQIEFQGLFARSEILDIESSGLDPNTLAHVWNVLVGLNSPLLHQWLVVVTALSGATLQHRWNVTEPLASLLHEWRVLPDLLTPFSEDIQKPVAEVEKTP